MIITIQRSLEDIKSSVEPYRKLAIIGCGGCAAVCQTGGTKQVDELARTLEGKEVMFTFQIDEPCDQRILARELRRISDRMQGVDAVIALACGTGVQALASSVDKPCVTGLDTLFAGTVIHSSSYLENCNACGECILNLTAAICPRTRCPKGIANGPCSEKVDETCCVDSESECVWISIARRAETLGLRVEAPEFRPMDWAKHVGPRSIPVREVSIQKTEPEG